MEEIKQAHKDFLTGFYTREYMVSALLRRIIDANLHKEKFSILSMDIDHFKKINDKYGHLWGDEFLKYVSSTLRLTLEDKGMIFRYGGDEFIVLFSTPNPREAFFLARQFNRVIKSRPFLLNGRLFKITVSCGLATYPDDAQGAEDLVQAADKALYFSKRYGRNTTTRAKKIALEKFKFVGVIFLEVFLIAALMFYLNTYLFRGILQKPFNRLTIRKLMPLGSTRGVKADSTVILKTGDVILGRIVSEDKKKIIMDISLGQGTCTMHIEKTLIKNITRIEQEKPK